MSYSCKKVVASGARSTAIMLEERCFGILNAEVADPTALLGRPKRLPFVSESIVNEIGSLESATLDPSRAVTEHNQGTSAIGGDFNVELAGNGYAWLMVQAIGKIIGAGLSDDPYTILPVDANGVNSDETAGYLQTPGEYTNQEITYNALYSDCDGYERGNYVIDASAMEPGFSFYLSRDGGTIGYIDGSQPTEEVWFEYLGMKVNTWSISASPTEIVTSTFNLLGRSERMLDMAPPSNPVERPDINKAFSGFNGAITIDDEELCVLSFEMSVNNNFTDGQYCMGQRFRNSLPEGRRQIEGSISIEFTDVKFYYKYLNLIPAKLVVEFDLFRDTNPGAEVMRIILPKIVFTGTTPTVGGPEAMSQPLPFKALLDKNPPDNSLVKGANTVAPNGFDIAIEIVTAGALV